LVKIISSKHYFKILQEVIKNAKILISYKEENNDIHDFLDQALEELHFLDQNCIILKK